MTITVVLVYTYGLFYRTTRSWVACLDWPPLAPCHRPSRWQTATPTGL